MNTLGQASTAAVAQYLRLAQARGIAPADLLSCVDLTPEQLQDDRQRVSGEQFQRLLLALLERVNTPILGLLSGDFVEPGSYSVLGHITMSCANLGEVVARIAPYEKLVGDMGHTQIYAQGDEIFIQWHCHYPEPSVREQMVDNVFASWINFARWLGNTQEHHPLRVELERNAPASHYLAQYQRRWHCPVLFEQPHSRIVIHKNLLSVPLRQGDSELRQALEQHAKAKLAELKAYPHPDEAELSAQVRTKIRAALNQGLCRQDDIAASLNMSTRTLQRKLEQQQSSFKQLLDLERQQLAEHWLKHSQHSTFDIATLLGFSELSSFHRSFKRWTGKTPKEVRDER